MKAKKLVLAIFVLIVFISMSVSPFAFTADWKTVRTVTGSADQTSSVFSINSQEWRLEWSFTPDSRFASLAFFGVLVYPEAEGAGYVDSFYVNGSTPTSGIENITGGMGNYHLEILAANIPSYTINVQQFGGTISNGSDGNFFGDLTNVILVILIAAIVVVAVVVVLLKRRKNQRSREQSLTPPSAPILL